jgi:hypothetical protein
VRAGKYDDTGTGALERQDAASGADGAGAAAAAGSGGGWATNGGVLQQYDALPRRLKRKVAVGLGVDLARADTALRHPVWPAKFGSNLAQEGQVSVNSKL